MAQKERPFVRTFVLRCLSVWQGFVMFGALLFVVIFHP
jgi:hypothetical protein